jgi:hypothetical protein
VSLLSAFHARRPRHAVEIKKGCDVDSRMFSLERSLPIDDGLEDNINATSIDFPTQRLPCPTPSLFEVPPTTPKKAYLPDPDL